MQGLVRNQKSFLAGIFSRTKMKFYETHITSIVCVWTYINWVVESSISYKFYIRNGIIYISIQVLCDDVCFQGRSCSLTGEGRGEGGAVAPPNFFLNYNMYIYWFFLTFRSKIITLAPTFPQKFTNWPLEPKKKKKKKKPITLWKNFKLVKNTIVGSQFVAQAQKNWVMSLIQ